MQLYADLRILTARPSGRDKAQAPHHLFGIAPASESWSVGRWLRAAMAVLAGVEQRGRAAIFVGGTGLYFRALTQGLAAIPAVPPAARAQAQTLFSQIGEAEFRARLAQVDPASEARILPGDRQRLTRALEVFNASGRPIGDWRAVTAPALGARSWRGLVLNPPKEILDRRCGERLTAMLEAGVLTEVDRLAGTLGFRPTFPR